MPGPLHHESLYRGPEVLERLSSLRLTLCGAGAVGSHLAESLVRHGAKRIGIVDHDRVEHHNISTQTYGESDVGAWKVEALRNHLFRSCGVEIESMRKKLDERNVRSLLKETDLIVDAFDNSESRQIVQGHARAAEIPCLHVGLNEEYCEIVWDEQYRVPRDAPRQEDLCDYPLARNLVQLAVIIGCEAILRWIAIGTRMSLAGTLRDFAVKPLERAG